MKKYLFPLLLGLFFCSACRKYQDGPAFTLLSKQARITGEWNLDVALLSTATSNAGITGRYPPMRMQIDRSDEFTVAFFDDFEVRRGEWSLEENKETFNWTLSDNVTTGIIGTNGQIVRYDSLERFDIERLTTGDLWLIDRFGTTLRFNKQ